MANIEFNAFIFSMPFERPTNNRFPLEIRLIMCEKKFESLMKFKGGTISKKLWMKTKFHLFHPIFSKNDIVFHLFHPFLPKDAFFHLFHLFHLFHPEWQPCVSNPAPPHYSCQHLPWSNIW